MSKGIMFLVLGLVSTLIGFITFLFLPDTPMKARFLSDAEKAAIIQHVAINETGVSNHKFDKSHLLAFVKDPQSWLLFIATLVVSTGIGIISIYGVTLIRSFGFDSKEAALLTLPGGAVGLTLTIAVAFIVRHGWLHRWAALVCCYAVAFIGTCLLVFLSKHNQAGNLVGLWMISAAIPTLGLKYHWITANVAGHTKRSLATASLSAAFSIGNIIGICSLPNRFSTFY